MGLTASIYKWSLGDCSNGGISGRCDKVTIVNAEGPFEPTENAPAVLIVPGNVAGTVKVVGAEEINGEWVEVKPDGLVGPMMGGCYVATPDSRFGELVEKVLGRRFYGAVALHDRYETVAEYARYSA